MGIESLLNKITKNNEDRSRIYLAAILLFALILRCYHITYELMGQHLFRQTQTAGLIKEYFLNGIDFLHPRMLTLGDPGILVLEFPLYQALVALLYKLFVPDVIFARLLSIIVGLLSIFYVYRISKRFFDSRTSLLSAFFFSMAPLNMYYQRVPMQDTFIVFLSLLMLDFLIEGYINNKKPYLVLGLLAAILGFMTKSPYTAPLLLPFMYLFCTKVKEPKKYLGLGLLILPFVCMILWQNNANATNEIYISKVGYPFEKLYSAFFVKLSSLNATYFGTIEQRLDINTYLGLGARVNKNILSKVGLVFFVAGLLTLYKTRINRFFYVWLISVVACIFTVLPMNLWHDYWQLPLAPVLAVFCGAGASWLIDAGKKRKYIFTLTILLLVAFSMNSLKYHHRFLNYTNGSDYPMIGQFIERSTEKESMVAISSTNHDVWTPEVMYFTNRRGFVMHHSRINPDMINYLKSKKIKYLALVDYKDNIDLELLSPYKVRSESERIMVYDISPADTDPGPSSP